MSEYKDRWIAALRSGEYQQGRAALCIEGADGVRRYCCLGVLAQLDGVLTRVRFVGDEVQYGWLEPSPFSSLPASPNDAMYYGVDGLLDRIKPARPPQLAEDIEAWTLPYIVANLNDANWTFEQIADYLEGVDF